MLCIYCQGICLAKIPLFVTVDDDEIEKCQLTNLIEAYKHHPNFKSLRLSGSRGCQLCVIISQVLLQSQESNGQILTNDDIIYRSIRKEPESALLLQLETDYSAQIYIYFIDETERQEDAGIFEIAIVPTFTYRSSKLLVHDEEPDAFFWRALEVWPQTDESQLLMRRHKDACMKSSAKEELYDLAGYAHHRHITSDPSSIYTMGILREWLLVCENSHADCSTNVKNPMPTRVIDLGHPDGSLIPRLYHSRGKPGIWATLSHCWGKTVTMTLTFATLEDRMQGISIAALPKNFQDAIAVTRILGIRYLWIDSLCIIQDSAEDWLKESAGMGEIYKHSFVTIAATNAEDSASGFLKKRIAEINCNIHLEEEVELQVCIRPRIEWYCFAEIGGPLSKRAWVLQERLLARRILHFGKQQIMWQCKSKTLAEAFCDTDQPTEGQIPEDVENMLRKQFHTETKASSDSELDPSTTTNLSLTRSPIVRSENYNMQDNIYDQWYHVIGKYGTLSLTKQSDKLPAIAGIARQVQIATGDTYLAGLWKSDIERGLQWSYQPLGILVNSPTPRAPSWSWAGPDIHPDRAVEYFSGSVNLNSSTTSHYSAYDHSVKFISCSPNFTSDTCLGNPTPGSITLLGLWIPAAFTNTTNTLDPDAQRFALSYTTPLLLAGHARPYAAARLDGDQAGIDTRSVSCLQLGKFNWSGREPREDCISALLLQRSWKGVGDGEREGDERRYVRIGLVVLFKSCDLRRGWEERAVEIV